MNMDEYARERGKSVSVKWSVLKYASGTVLEVGSGPWRLFNSFTTVDKFFPIPGLNWRPDIESEIEDIPLVANSSVDAVFSSYTLQHLDSPDKAISCWWKKIKVGGYLILNMPISDSISVDKIIDVIDGTAYGADIAELSTGEKEKSFFVAIKKISEKAIIRSHERAAQHRKRVCVTRYGGFGDVLMASIVLPGLKKLGYHVTFDTTDSGHNLLKDNPHIDEFIVHAMGLIYGDDIFKYWEYLRGRFDLHINFSESVERTLLAVEKSPAYFWPKAAREKLFAGVNYDEIAYDIAGLEYSDEHPPVPSVFYPSKKEVKWAVNMKRKIGGKIVLIALSGSSPHKFSTHIDSLIAWFMLNTQDVTFVLTGDLNCKLLEAGWQNEKRVVRTSGEWSIRQSLTFAQHSDCVLAPQTGVLAAVSGLAVPKVVLMSHSTPHSLAKHWYNTKCIEPDVEKVPCYPCFQLHTGFDVCQQDKSGAAVCQAAISPVEMREAVQEALNI